MGENKQSFTVKLADDIKKELVIKNGEADVHAQEKSDQMADELAKKISDSIQIAAEVAKSISDYHLECFNKRKKAQWLLIGEQCMNLETHWILNWRNVGFRASILRICKKLEISIMDDIKDKNPLYQKLANKKILVSDSRELPLSSSSYKNKICPDFNFNNWKNEVKHKVDGFDGSKRLTVVFVYQRIFTNFILDEDAKTWLINLLEGKGEVYVLTQSRPEKFSKVSHEKGKFVLEEVKKDDDLLAKLS